MYEMTIQTQVNIQFNNSSAFLLLHEDIHSETKIIKQSEEHVYMDAHGKTFYQQRYMGPIAYKNNFLVSMFNHELS